MMIEIFKTGKVEYPEDVADKPVLYREEDLQRVAMSTNKVDLTNEHTDEVIGTLQNFTYKDGSLYADEPDVDLKGKGISPSFLFSLKDMGDYYVPWNISLKNAGLTENPRSQIFYNNIEKEMKSLEDKEKLLKDIQANQEEIRNQREEIGILRNRNKTLDESLRSKAEIEEQLKEKEAELSNLRAKMEKLEADANAYKEIENKQREELISKLSNDDPELKEEYSKMSLEQLQFWSEKSLLSTKPKGTGTHQDGTDVDDGTNFVRSDDVDVTYDDYLIWKKEQGLR